MKLGVFGRGRLGTAIAQAAQEAPDLELAWALGREGAPKQVGAVIANAIFDATGARLYKMPMTPDRVKEALAKVSKVQ